MTTGQTTTTTTGGCSRVDGDVIIIGAGFSGLYMLYKAREELGLEAFVLEAGDGVGGTWYWNRYPGARSDSDSYLYSYSFDEDLQQEWEWTERYPEQHEIRAYLEHVADRFDLNRSIHCGIRVTDLDFDATTDTWTATTDTGRQFTSRFVVAATGSLSAANTPDFAGADTFRGRSYHTGDWPHEGVDFTGRRVAVIGTGASAVQAIPLIAEQAAELTVFQRTANYIVPARNGPVDPDITAERKRNYSTLRQHSRESFAAFNLNFIGRSAHEDTPEQRYAEFQKRWEDGGFGLWLGNYDDIFVDDEANRTVREFLHQKIREIVTDPATAELLIPRDEHAFGCKRIPLDSGYYETFNEEHVGLVDVRSNPIAEITPRGIRLRDGTEHGVDAIVYATGFDAMTGSLDNIDIRGRDGRLLRDKWYGGPVSYLGLTVTDYPNLFTITGPGSPSVLSNMPTSIEQHVNLVATLISEADRRGSGNVEPTRQAEEQWTQHCQDVAQETLFPQANSWYMGANIPGKPQIFLPYLGGVGEYRRKCDHMVSNDYQGFAFDGVVDREGAAV